jgi:hypothetical protein
VVGDARRHRPGLVASCTSDLRRWVQTVRGPADFLGVRQRFSIAQILVAVIVVVGAAVAISALTRSRLASRKSMWANCWAMRKR